MSFRETLADACVKRKAERMRKADIIQEMVDEVMSRFMPATELILKLDCLLDEVYAMSQPQVIEVGGVEVVTPPMATREALMAKKILIDANLKLLNKHIPDKKAIELTGDKGEPLFTRESRQELEDNLKRMGIDPSKVLAANALR